MDSCKTACNLTARGDGDSALLECCEEEACLLVKSLSLETSHAHIDMRTQTQSHACMHTDTGKFCLKCWCMDCAARFSHWTIVLSYPLMHRVFSCNSFKFSLEWQERHKCTTGSDSRVPCVQISLYCLLNNLFIQLG